jgi:hypothetical protein
MKFISVKYIEIFTDGTANFSYKGLKSSKQIIFHEKDFANSVFFRKPINQQLVRDVSRNFYKLKYKF